METVNNESRTIDVQGILDRVKDLESLRFNSEVARALGSDKNTLAGWLSRNSIPNHYLIEYSNNRNVSLDWLIFGIGAPDRGDTLIHQNSGAFNLTIKPEALYQAAEQLFAACERSDSRPTPAGFKLMLKNLVGVVLAGGEATDEEVNHLVKDMLRAQQQSLDKNI